MIKHIVKYVHKDMSTSKPGKTKQTAFACQKLTKYEDMKKQMFCHKKNKDHVHSTSTVISVYIKSYWNILIGANGL